MDVRTAVHEAKKSSGKNLGKWLTSRPRVLIIVTNARTLTENCNFGRKASFSRGPDFKTNLCKRAKRFPRGCAAKLLSEQLDQGRHHDWARGVLLSSLSDGLENGHHHGWAMDVLFS